MSWKTMPQAEGTPRRNPNPSPNPFVYPHEKTLLGYDEFHVMPGAREEEEDYDDGLLSRIFWQHRLQTEGSGGEPVEGAEDANRATEGTRVDAKSGRLTRKRASGKTDRHSKIRTAQGLRDRRIRLSVKVSRKFFDLQEMLGFDKASNTIEWLITKSRGAIKGLSLRRGGASSMGVPEIHKSDVSIIDEVGPADSNAVIGIQKEKSCTESSRVRTKRELRERARVRARERTREKTMEKISKPDIHEEKPNDCANSSSSGGHRDFGSVNVIEKFLRATGAYKSSLDAEPTGSYYSENANCSGDDRFQVSYPGNATASHLGGYYP